MNLRFVEAFYWVATLESVTLAAARLSLTQSAVSNRVAALERELGQPLFDRRAQRMKPTALGDRFLLQASRFLELRREVQETFAAPDSAPATLRLGANESVLHNWLMPLIDALGANEPRLKLELSIDTTPALHEEVRRGTLDICFGTGALESDGVRHCALAPIELVFVEAGRSIAATAGTRRRTRAAASPRPVGLAALSAATIITFQRGSQPTRALLGQIQELQVTPARLLFTPSISAMLELTRRGFGVATLPRQVVAAAVARGELRLVDLGVTLPPVPVVACWRPDPASGLIDRVIDMARSQAGAQPTVRSGERIRTRSSHSSLRSDARRKS